MRYIPVKAWDFREREREKSLHVLLASILYHFSCSQEFEISLHTNCQSDFHYSYYQSQYYLNLNLNLNTGFHLKCKVLKFWYKYFVWKFLWQTLKMYFYIFKQFSMILEINNFLLFWSKFPDETRMFCVRLFAEIMCLYLNHDNLTENGSITNPQLLTDITSQILPSLQQLLLDADPVPLYGLKLILALIETSPDFIRYSYV